MWNLTLNFFAKIYFHSCKSLNLRIEHILYIIVESRIQGFFGTKLQNMPLSLTQMLEELDLARIFGKISISILTFNKYFWDKLQNKPLSLNSIQMLEELNLTNFWKRIFPQNISSF